MAEALMIVPYSLEQTYLIGGHRERVNVTRFRGAAIIEVELRRVQKFRGHIADDPGLGNCRVTWFHDGGISNDAQHPEVPKAYITLLGDQYVSLDRTSVRTYLDSRTSIMAHRVDITVYDTQ